MHKLLSNAKKSQILADTQVIFSSNPITHRIIDIKLTG
jgi:hypothetical protein